MAKNIHASALGRLGGLTRTEKKRLAGVKNMAHARQVRADKLAVKKAEVARVTD
jgi:hypothetical protein